MGAEHLILNTLEVRANEMINRVLSSFFFLSLHNKAVNIVVVQSDPSFQGKQPPPHKKVAPTERVHHEPAARARAAHDVVAP